MFTSSTWWFMLWWTWRWLGTLVNVLRWSYPTNRWYNEDPSKYPTQQTKWACKTKPRNECKWSTAMAKIFHWNVSTWLMLAVRTHTKRILHLEGRCSGTERRWSAIISFPSRYPRHPASKEALISPSSPRSWNSGASMFVVLIDDCSSLVVVDAG